MLHYYSMKNKYSVGEAIKGYGLLPQNSGDTISWLAENVEYKAYSNATTQP